MNDYTAYGLRVRSALPLPFASLPGVPGGERGSSDEPDVTVRLVEATATLPAPARAGVRSVVWEAAPGGFVLNVDGVARYLVTGGCDVTVEPRGGDDRDVGHFLAGPVFVALLRQRGVVAFRASAIATEAGAVLFAGGSGVGKSALLAGLVARGHAMLADAATAVVPDGSGRPEALPAFPRIHLWADALDALGSRGRAGETVRAGVEKYPVPAQRFHAAPLPVRAVYVLGAHNRSGVELVPIQPGNAFELLCLYTCRTPFPDAAGGGPAHFRIVSTLARRTPVVHVGRPMYSLRVDAARLDAVADRIGDRLRDGGGTEEGRCSPAAPGAKARFRPGRPLVPPRGAAAGSASAGSVVWLASWPRSGSTWLRTVLTGYLLDDDGPAPLDRLIGRPLASLRELFYEQIGLDSSDLTPEEILRLRPLFHERLARELATAGGGEGAPAFVRVHDACLRTFEGTPLFPKSVTAGVVYLVRNPLDVAVSFAHFLAEPVDRVIGWMNSPDTCLSGFRDRIRQSLPEPLLTWGGHVSSWLDQEDLPVHAARYEDLLADPRAGFGEIVRFAGLEPDDARLARAVDRAAFHRLRAQEEESGYRSKPPEARFFFRAGVAGSWRSALRPPQVRALVDAHGPAMERFGYLREAEAFLAQGAGDEVPAAWNLLVTADVETSNGHAATGELGNRVEQPGLVEQPEEHQR